MMMVDDKTMLIYMIIFSACEPLGSFRTMQSESDIGFNLFKLQR